MKRTLLSVLCLCNTLLFILNAQTLYVDPVQGNDAYEGSFESPLNSLEEAIHQANALTGQGHITIRLMPGIYTLQNRMDIRPVRMLSDTVRYTIEAAMMPEEANWSPEQMPVILSVSNNNSNTQFPHATGFLVASAHVTIKGLKFLGNPNPEVDYYYPISKEDKQLADLEVIQCYFIGDKEAAKIQGGVWAHGPQNNITQCIFYECRNAVLFFNNVRAFTIQNTIVYGSYESAFWLGQEDVPFTFSDNIITNCNYFLIGPPELNYSSSFSNSIIAGNLGFVGHWSRTDQKVMPTPDPGIKLANVLRSGQVELMTNQEVKLDKYHLHVQGDSTGSTVKAGVLIKK